MKDSRHKHNNNYNDIHEGDEEDITIREAVKAELESIEEPPTAEAWAKFSERWKKEGSDGNNTGKRRISGWLRPVSIAACILLLIGGGLWLAETEFSYLQEISPEAEPDDADVLMTEEEVREEEHPEEELDLPEPREDAYLDIYEEDEEAPDYLPETLNGFRRYEKGRSADPLRAPYFIFRKEDKELWLVELRSFEHMNKLLLGEDNRYIPGESLEDIDPAARNLVKDNLDKPVLIWSDGEKIFLLWARSEGIIGEDLLELPKP